MPFFSVVIPLYNKADQIRQTLDYVLAQTFTDFEIIIVNDGSTDDGLTIAQSITDDRIHIYSQTNKGAGAARNYGITKAKAEYIALLDADDIWYNNHLECLYDAIQKFPDQVWFSNAYSVKHSDSLTVKGNYNIDVNAPIILVDDFFKGSIIHPLAWTSCTAFKVTAFNALGQFDASILSGQDIDLWFKFGLQHQLVFNTTYTCVYDKTVGGSLSKENHQASKYQLFASYDTIAAENDSFKHQLTIYKYALAIQCKLSNNTAIFSKLKREIDTNYLNTKQKFILFQPVFLTKWFKKIHAFLVKYGLYSSAYN